MTLDDRPYYNPSAVPFCLEQPFCPCPTSPPSANGNRPKRKPADAHCPRLSGLPNLLHLFEAALNRAFEELESLETGRLTKPLLYLLARHCYKAGIPEEE